MQYYYLTRAEIEHYQHMLDKGYKSYTVNVGGQLYIIFPVVDKEYVGIAWPSITGKLDAIPANDTVFVICLDLQNLVIHQIQDQSVKILLFPRFS